MVHEFSRTELLIGSDGLKRLTDSSVLVFGVGGVGSHCIEALARGGVGRLILVDADRVALTNINRQSIASHSTVGKYKTHVMRERILDINPRASVSAYEEFILPENIENFFDGIGGKVDYIIDAIDTVAAKLAIAEYAKRNQIHPEMFEITHIAETSVCPLCRVMRRELKRRNIRHLKVLYSREVPRKPRGISQEETSKRQTPASISFVPPVAGLLIAGEVIRDLAGLT